MIWVALKMLTGNRGKYLGIILGVAFAALLIAQQSSIFCGLMRLTTSQIKDIQGADIWVMDRNVQFIDDIKPMSENDLYRVRGVSGVQWAVRLYKGLSRAKMANGNFQQTILIGLDDATLVGAPQQIVLGNLADLRRPDAVIIDEDGYRQLWPDEPFELGRTFEMNDRLATIVGVCKARRTFQTFPVVYTRYSQATLFVPRERKVLSFILAQPEATLASEEVCRRISAQTGLKAETRDQFSETTIWYYMKKTGIPINFGITVLLGFIVGAAIAGQTFYLFTVENLKQFGALKAMGASNGTLVMMILLQAILVAFIGYGLGVGAAAIFGALTKSLAKLAFFMPWEVLVGTGVAVVAMAILAALLSIRKVMVLEPAIVFQGYNRMAIAQTTATAVTCRGVTKNYGTGNAQVMALRGVDLEVFPAELTLLVGPSGCGKTTLLSVVAGILEPTSGEVVVLGTDLVRLSQRRKVVFRRQNVGFVFQQFNLLPALTAAENVAIPLLLGGWSRRKAVAAAKELLDKLGMRDRMHALPGKLSGGQQQRVAIARALVHQPRLLVCDEPTSALDAKTGHTIMELLRSVALEGDRAVIIVTHDSRIFEFGDRIARMEDGQVVEVHSQQANRAGIKQMIENSNSA